MPSEENKVCPLTEVVLRRDTDVGPLVPRTQERIIRVVEFGRVRLRGHPQQPGTDSTEPTGRASLRMDPFHHLRWLYEEQPATLAHKVSKPPPVFGTRLELLT